MAINRRTFLIRGSGVLAAAGAATAIPAFLPALVGADAAEPRVGSAPSIASTGFSNTTMPEPLVAHVRDLSTGEISLLSGEKEFVIHDRHLARSLFAATQ
jgi:hypothetical protein